VSDYLASLGTLGLTARLRQLSDRMQECGRRLYVTLGVPLEPNWHALLLLLDERGKVSVTEAATALGVSHPAVIDLARRVEAAGFIETSADPADGRRRVMRLSLEGQRRLPEFKRLWDTIGAEIDDLVVATAGSDAMAALSTLEAELDLVELDRRIERRLRAPTVARVRMRDPAPDPLIRNASDGDRESVVELARELVRSGDTYAYDPAISDAELWAYWRPSSRGDGYVAVLDDRVAGVFVIRPNMPGPGSHVANASYAVRADLRGLGLGRVMGEASLRIAVELGYSAMQFNAVVATNLHAVRLWRSLGFRIVGTIPDGFRLPDGALTSHYIMYRGL
jgi:DNA-binding MarR family transcriptional regulator/GNAT superfamily N-acetyltransferase